ncbi:MAG: hypothetical protein KAJ19_21380 [Gammaproteobacteria bacterium]|nr:hypothetical protein [Gammaproteobacteria bacterium]
MKRVDFSYDVYGEAVFTGKELWLLKQCSDGHYDFACRTCFADEPREPYKNFGKVWIAADLLWGEYRRRKEAGEDIEFDERLRLEDCLEAETRVRASSDQLDFCMKILEPTNRFGLSEADKAACERLSGQIRAVFHEIQEEGHQKAYGVGLELTDGFRDYAVYTKKVGHWGDLETPELRDLAVAYARELGADPPVVDAILLALRRRRGRGADGVDVPREP